MVDEISYSIQKSFEEHVLHMEDFSALVLKAYAEQGSDFNGYTASTRYYIHRADAQVLSIRIHGDEYTGGAHPNYGVQTLNFDTATGRALELTDIITDLDRTDPPRGNRGRL